MASQDDETSRKRHCEFREKLRAEVIRPRKNDDTARLCDKLEDDEALDNLLLQLKQDDTTRSIGNILDELGITGWTKFLQVNAVLQEILKFKVDKDKLWGELMSKEILTNGCDLRSLYDSSCFCKDAAAWSKHPKDILPQLGVPGKTETSKEAGKLPTYTAFSGASGSGKTHTLLWTLSTIIAPNLSPDLWCFKYYISCRARDSQSLLEYVKEEVTKKLNQLISHPYYNLQDFMKQCQKTWLVLLLDEVPSRFDHQTYYELPGALEDELKFEKVVLLVGSTAISPDVFRQPTSKNEVLNIRMKPVDEEMMTILLRFHLQRLKPKMKQQELCEMVRRLFREMPVLFDLMANQRCAVLTANVLVELLRNMYEIPDGWYQGHSATLLSMVACKYQELNGLRNQPHSTVQRLMLESLALLAAQPVVEENLGVDRDPKEGSLAYLATEAVEIGLVERAILPDEPLEDTTKVKVDGHYEFQMSPALTLICVASIVPWIEGIYNADDHFEALVATLMVAMRYAQTNKLYPIHRLALAVPYSGNDEHLYFEPDVTIDGKCFINGPQAPYSDIILAGVRKDFELPDGTAAITKALSEVAAESGFPVEPLLVQCKLTANTEASCNFRNEYAKMGFFNSKKGSGDLESPDGNPFTEKEGQHKQFKAGQWLTKHWVAKAGGNAQVAFATNKCFQGSVDIKTGVTLLEVERDCSYAWKKLYPIDQLVRQVLPGVIGRNKIEIEECCTG